jgi:hypothetical protein
MACMLSSARPCAAPWPAARSTSLRREMQWVFWYGPCYLDWSTWLYRLIADHDTPALNRTGPMNRLHR